MSESRSYLLRRFLNIAKIAVLFGRQIGTYYGLKSVVKFSTKATPWLFIAGLVLDAISIIGSLEETSTSEEQEIDGDEY
jgi:hypothetical protein